MKMRGHGSLVATFFEIVFTSNVLGMNRHELRERGPDWHKGRAPAILVASIRLQVKRVRSCGDLNKACICQSSAQIVDLARDLVDFYSLIPGASESHAREICLIIND